MFIEDFSANIPQGLLVARADNLARRPVFEHFHFHDDAERPVFEQRLHELSAVNYRRQPDRARKQRRADADWFGNLER